MNPRVRLVVIGIFACAFAALGGVWIAALTGEDEQPVAQAFEGFQQPEGLEVPAFSLRNQDGERVGPATGEWSIYSFIYSTCEDTCPTQTMQVRGALDDLGHDVQVYGVSVDPANDTPARATAFLAKQFMIGRMDFLLGTQADLQPLWDAFGVQPQRDGREHSARVVIVDPQGRPVRGWPASQLTADALRRDLQRLGA